MKEANAQRILFWVPGGMPLMLDVEGALAQALHLRGAGIHAVLCDGAYQGCILRVAAKNAPVSSWGSQGSSETGLSCSECKRACSSRLKRLGVPHSFIGDHVDSAELSALRQSTDRISWDDLGGLRYGTLALGKNVRSSIYRYLKGEPLKGHEEVIREYAFSALVCAAAAQRAMDWFSPTRLFMSHGVYADWGPALQAAFARAIPVCAWMASYLTARFYFRNIEDPSRIDLHNISSEAWRRTASEALSPLQDRHLNAFLEQRYRKQVAFDLHGMAPYEGNAAALRERYDLSSARPIWGILCHINWDAVIDASPMAYETLDQWLIQTVTGAMENPDVQWIVKVHPAEAWLDTVDGAERLIRRRFPHLPPHMRLIPAAETISPLDFMHLVDGGVTGYGTAGLELALLGKPVILAGEAHYGQKGFTHDGLGPSVYQLLLSKAASFHALSPEQRTLARKYAFTYFIARQIPLPVVCTPKTSWWEFQPDRAHQLEPGKDPFVEFICSKILTGGDFIMPDGLVELAEEGQWMKSGLHSAHAPSVPPQPSKSCLTPDGNSEPSDGSGCTDEILPLEGFDPLGEVFSYKGRILRGVFAGYGERAQSVYRICQHTGLFDAGIISTSICPKGDWTHMGYDLIFEHEPIPFVTYAFEWPPSMFKDAAVFQLHLAQAMLLNGLLLKDCGVTTNVAFDGTQPKYIDFLSIIPKEDLVKQTWLDPLGFQSPFQLLWSRETGLFNGIFCRMFYPGVLYPMYLFKLKGYAAAQKRLFETVLNTSQDIITEKEAFQGAQNGLETSYRQALAGREHALIHDDWDRFIEILQREIGGIDVALNASDYTTYYGEKGEDFKFHPSPDWKPKQWAVFDALQKFKPQTVLDIGANTGWFSILAARSGARVLAMDNDAACMDILYRKAKAERLPISPVVMDFITPTPEVSAHVSLANNPRRRLSRFASNGPILRSSVQRMQGDFVLALAILHHLVLGLGKKLGEVIQTLASYTGKTLLIEFVSREDPLVAGEPQFFKAHYRNPNDFQDYTADECRSCLERFFQTVEFKKLTDTRSIFVCSQKLN